MPVMTNTKPRILIAEDDTVSRYLLQRLLTQEGYSVVAARDGNEAWQALQVDSPPPIAILDWMMPGLDGLALCRKIRASRQLRATHIILLTARQEKDDLVQGFDAGADDYVTKPFENEELRARVRVGARIVGLRAELEERVAELEEALSKIKTLEGLLPICSYCKNIRSDEGYWHKVEEYLGQRAGATFTHGICPDCYEKYIQPELDLLKARKQKTTAEEKPT